MIPQFSREDVKSILYYLGKLIQGLGIIMLVPLFVAILNREWAPSLNFIVSILCCLFIGNILYLKHPKEINLNWRQGMSLVALSWLVAMFLSAIPLFLSGNYLSYLDSCFEAMSAYTTTGFTLAKNLDYMAHSYNFWRHFMCFIGGQGIILVAMTFFVKGGSASKVYMSEGKEEKIMPNVVQTAKFIWLVSFTYLIIGTSILFFINFARNASVGRALFHSVCLFMSGWDTAGFSVQSQNIMYYHSPVIELVTGVLFILGAINFGVHYAVWTGKPQELFKNYELRIYMLSILTLFTLICFSFINNFPFPDYFSFFRKTFYHLISAHTSVGYSSWSINNFNRQWHTLGVLALILAMSFGGCSSSTAGGIKMLRLGIFFKGIKKEMRRLTSPESAIIIEKIHHIKEIVVEDNYVKMVSIIIILYITSFFLGSMVGVFYGYPFLGSLFESVSATGNTGLSVGIVSSSAPAGLKVIYILQMWLGRLEFLSVFVLLRFLVSLKSPQ
ncbi:TrkH family potassium uptake protein [bacterium]|nr:TrkH family potassium uptake protein [bacterium]